MCWSSRCIPVQVLPGTAATSLLLPHFCLLSHGQTRRRLSRNQACALENVLVLSCFLLPRRQEGEEREEAESGESRLTGYPRQDGQFLVGSVFSRFPCAARRCLWKKSNPLGSWLGNGGREIPSCFLDQSPEPRQEVKPLEYTHPGFCRGK